jgi:hypothetical protein
MALIRPKFVDGSAPRLLVENHMTDRHLTVTQIIKGDLANNQLVWQLCQTNVKSAK